MKKWLNEKILNDNKKTLALIACLTFFVLFIYQIVLFCSGTYFNSGSDDVVQYSPFLGQYIKFFKEGYFSLYNFSNNLGASSFADAYYVPIDIFSLIMFVLSLVINEIIAFSIVELMKVFLGVMLFAVFLQKCKYKNTTVFLLSFMYFCVGGSWVLSVFPVYFSLFFYLPASLLVVKCYREGKKWILPLYGTALIFYNFYNAYTLFIFMCVAFVVGTLKDKEIGFKQLAKETLFFALNIVLSVFIGLFALLPSVLYILNNSARDTFKFEILFDFQIYLRMISKMFAYEVGTVNFVGGVGSSAPYVQNHFSYYIGVLGIFIFSFIFRMKDRESKVYKWFLICLGCITIFPAFSMIFTGVATAYLRWLSLLNIVFIYVIGHIIEKCDFKELKNKKINLIVIGTLYLIAFAYNFIVILTSKDIFEVNKSFYYLCILLVVFAIAVMYIIFYLSKQKNLFVGIFAVEMIIALVINLSVPYNGIKSMDNVEAYEDIQNVLYKLDIKSNSLDRVYIGESSKYNSSRYFDVLTNEMTFHSFLTKSIYDYQSLYKDIEKVNLAINNIRNYSPTFSRSVDYKYIVLAKEKYNYRLDHLDVYYEDDDFVVYINNDYEPFYVYEDYYDYEDVLNKDYLNLQMNLFKGVILEEESPLNKIEYEEILTNKLSAKKNVSFIKEFNSYNGEISLNKEGVVYIYGKDITSVLLGENQSINTCGYKDNHYECIYKENDSKISIKSSSDNVYYYVKEKHDKENYLIYDIDTTFNSKYLSYYSHENEGSIVIVDNNGNTRECLGGFCYLDGFDVDKIYVSTTISESNVDNLYISYLEENLSYYNANKKDRLANNKNLSYSGSTVTFSYSKKGNTNSNQVVVLPITYSEEWSCDDEMYKIVKANGGYLGVLVNENIDEVNVTLKFSPKGFNVGLIGSLAGIVIYTYFYCFKRKEETLNIKTKTEDMEG